jgi:putative ABC transport system substrate-binding protein
MFDMRRREVITLIGGAVAAWPLAARGPQTAVPVVGHLDPGTAEKNANVVAAFRKGLGETGYVEGHNVAIEHRWADGQYDRLPALAADLVSRQVALIVTTNGLPAARVAKKATTTIPVVFFVGIDPVAYGLVASLNRPGGNLTGVNALGTELGPKRLELLHDLLPATTAIAALVNPTNAAAETQSRALQAAANSLGLRLHVLHASTERDLVTAFTTLVRLEVRGLVIGADGLMNDRSDQIAALALQHSVLTIYQYREFANVGGLMSYGGSITEAYSRLGVYAGRILKGEKPADLPVQQSTKVELVINLKTAKALGVTVPAALLARADEVIE